MFSESSQGFHIILCIMFSLQKTEQNEAEAEKPEAVSRKGSGDGQEETWLWSKKDVSSLFFSQANGYDHTIGQLRRRLIEEIR